MNDNTSPSEHPQVSFSQQVLCEQLNDEVVLLDMRSGSYFGLSPVASRFWQALVDGQTLQQAEASVLESYDVSEERLSIDLAALLAELEEKKLLSRRTSIS